MHDPIGAMRTTRPAGWHQVPLCASLPRDDVGLEVHRLNLR
jgi:hypothetical protein